MNINVKGNLFPKEAITEINGKRGWMLFGDFIPEDVALEMMKNFQPPKVKITHEKISYCSMSCRGK